MEKLDLSKLKLASSSISERIKTSSAQMGRTISSKMKDLLQSPSPESKAVDDATAAAAEPNWGLNLRICAAIGAGEYDAAEIVRAIKKKLAAGRDPATQSLTLDLLEACTSNCDKVCSAVASEKVLEDLVKLIEDSMTDHGNRVRAMQLIRSWGESKDLEYLPVFHQTYMQLKSREIPAATEEENFPAVHYNLESYLGQGQIAPPETYPVPNSTGAENEENGSFISFGFRSVEERKESLAVARNSLDILSSILNSDAQPKPLKDDLTISMLEKCKECLPIVQRIIESTSDDEVMLFDALNLHDELQLAISRHAELAADVESGQPKSDNAVQVSLLDANYNTTERTNSNNPSHQEGSTADRSGAKNERALDS